MEIELTDIEDVWATKFQKLIAAKPQALRLVLDACGCDGNIEIFSKDGSVFTKSDKSWIRKINNHLRLFPDTAEFWLLSNIDGWNIGKGKPAFYSSTTVGTGGATGSLSDDFSTFYHWTAEIEYYEVDEAERDDCQVIIIKSNLGDLNIQNFSK